MYYLLVNGTMSIYVRAKIYLFVILKMSEKRINLSIVGSKKHSQNKETNDIVII